MSHECLLGRNFFVEPCSYNNFENGEILVRQKQLNVYNYYIRDEIMLISENGLGKENDTKYELVK